MRLRTLVTFTLVASFVAPAAKAQSRDSVAHATTRKQGRILGIFDDESSLPIEGADVIDVFVDALARTPANGLIELSGFQSRHDSAAVHVRKIGYADTAFVVMVGPRDTVPVQVFLRKVTTVAGMITEATVHQYSSDLGLREFEELALDKSTNSIVVSPVEMRKGDGRSLRDFLHSKGIGATIHCPPQAIRVFEDGLPAPNIGVSDKIPSSMYEAAIFYSMGAAPLQYNSTSKKACGVLLLWTRRQILKDH